jgi:uncharacterized OsmC-like protein
MNVQRQVIPADNGVNVEALMGAREALTETPAAAAFTWRATCNWLSGAHSKTTIESFSGLGTEHRHVQPYTIEADHPTCFAATDHGATPTEIVLAALASCLSAGIASVAQNRGIQVHRATARVEADMDLQGVLGIDPDVRMGFEAVRVRYDIDADASREDIAAVVAQAQKRSAVFDIITNPGSVQVTLD